MENRNKLSGEVVHIVSPEHAVNYMWEKNSEKLPRNLEIISIDDVLALPSAYRNNYIAERNLEEGAILILDPIQKIYVPAREAHNKLSESKFNALMHIASLLGAKKVSVKVDTYECQTREIRANGEIGYRISSMSTSMTESEKNTVNKKFSREKTFSGTYSTKGYTEAKRFCEEKSLLTDPTIRQLLEDRRPDHPNPLKKDVYSFELSSSSESALDIAFKLNILGGVFRIEANLNESISKSRKLSISTLFEF